MKTLTLRVVSSLFLLAGIAAAADPVVTWTNFIRQVQTPSGIQLDVPVVAIGNGVSNLGVESGGSRYELWTIRSSPLTSYLLDTKFVGAYIPAGVVTIISEDKTGTILRTRADKPFQVQLDVSGLSTLATAPLAAKSVTFLHHVQSYGADGTSIGIDRTLATLTEQSSITTNVKASVKTYNVTIPSFAVPANLTKIRGEERFSLFSLADGASPASQLASQYIQVWPVATATISGLVNDQIIKNKIPAISVILTDLYPNSQTYAQVYPGKAVLGTVGTIVPGLGVIKNTNVPTNETLPFSSWDSVFKGDGVWTLEILTSTPFGIDRLASVTFTVRRSVTVNGTVTTLE